MNALDYYASRWEAGESTGVAAAAQKKREKADASSGGGWMASLMNAMMQAGEAGRSAPAADAMGTPAPAPNAAAEAASAAARNRAAQSDAANEVAELLDEAESPCQPATVAQKQEEVLETLGGLFGDVRLPFSATIDPAVYEKMATDPAFNDKIHGLLDKMKNHPWFTEEIPGLVSRFAYIGPDGECLIGVICTASENEAENSELNQLLMEMLGDVEEEMYKSILHLQKEGEEKTYDQMIQEIIDEFIEERKAQKEAEADSDIPLAG